VINIVTAQCYLERPRGGSGGGVTGPRVRPDPDHNDYNARGSYMGSRPWNRGGRGGGNWERSAGGNSGGWQYSGNRGVAAAATTSKPITTTKFLPRALV